MPGFGQSSSTPRESGSRCSPHLPEPISSEEEELDPEIPRKYGVSGVKSFMFKLIRRENDGLSKWSLDDALFSDNLM